MQLVTSIFLRRALALDAAASGATGVVALLGASPLAQLLSLPEQLLRFMGAALIPFVVFVAYAGRREAIVRRNVVVIIALNAAWVIASVALVTSGVIRPNAFGYAFVLGQAIAVALLAGLQFVALRRGEAAAIKQPGIIRRASGAALILIAAAAAALPAQAPAGDEATVRAVLTRMIDAFNAGDFAGVAATYATNGTMIAGDGNQHTGRAAIERFFVEMRASLPTYTRFHAAVTSVRFLGPHVAVLLSEGGFMIPGETGVAPERLGLQSLIAVRDGSQWSAVFVQRTRIPSPRPAR